MPLTDPKDFIACFLAVPPREATFDTLTETKEQLGAEDFNALGTITKMSFQGLD